MIQFKNDAGIPFNARIVDIDGKMGVQFYDARYARRGVEGWGPDGWTYGQPVSRYYADTLTGEDGFGSGAIGTTGLLLDGSIADWQISAENGRAVLGLIEGERARIAAEIL